MEVEIMTTESVAKLLKTTPSKVNAMIRTERSLYESI